MSSVPFRGSWMNPAKPQTCWHGLGGSSDSGPHLSPASSPPCSTFSWGSGYPDYHPSAHAVPSAHSTPLLVVDLQSPALCFSRLSLEISASEKLSLGSLSQGQGHWLRDPMVPWTFPSHWIIIHCLLVSSIKVRSPWELWLCLSGSWLCLVLCMLSPWEVLKMCLLNEWANEVKISYSYPLT